jgi:hypothetical protein
LCQVAAIEFFIESVEKEEFEDKRVLEVGSKYINGSVRPLIERFCSSKEYKKNTLVLILSLENLLTWFCPLKGCSNTSALSPLMS